MLGQDRTGQRGEEILRQGGGERRWGWGGGEERRWGWGGGEGGEGGGGGVEVRVVGWRRGRWGGGEGGGGGGGGEGGGGGTLQATSLCVLLCFLAFRR